MKRLQQRGAATLVAVTLLCLIAMLSGVYAGRSLLAEQRASAAQYRAAQAHEAAEAGVEWLAARLNGGRMDGSCSPDDDSDGKSLRDRYLHSDALTGKVSASTAWPVLPACAKTGAAWSCACPSAGPPDLPVMDDGLPQPAFAIAFDQGKAQKPGVLHAVVTGCAHRGKRCLASEDDTRSEGTATIELDFALLPALRTAPAAALTARGTVSSPASLGVFNGDANSSGIAIHAGAAIDAPNARVSGLPGSPRTAALVDSDPSLSSSALSDAQLFVGLFGIDKATYRRLPTVVTLAGASGDATTALQAALSAGQRAIWVTGDLRLSDASVGSPADPLVLVVEGRLQVSGALRLHGLVYAGNLVWDNAAPASGWLRGAAVVEADFSGNGAPDIVYDPAILRRLQKAQGSFVKLPGSWKDF